MSESQWITAQKAAEIMGVTDAAVRYMCIKGTIKAQKFGKAWQVDREAAEQYRAAKGDKKE